jgi:hypothetical protein
MYARMSKALLKAMGKTQGCRCWIRRSLGLVSSLDYSTIHHHSHKLLSSSGSSEAQKEALRMFFFPFSFLVYWSAGVTYAVTSSYLTQEKHGLNGSNNNCLMVYVLAMHFDWFLTFSFFHLDRRCIHTYTCGRIQEEEWTPNSLRQV